MEEEIKINQQSKPAGSYNASIDEFPMKYYYSGYFNNYGNNSININLRLWTGELFQTLNIPSNSILYLEDLPIKSISIEQGNYTYSFIGTFYEGYKPKYKIDLKTFQSYIVGYSPLNVTLNNGSGNVRSWKFQTSSTPNQTITIPEWNQTPGALTILADLNNTDVIYVGGYVNNGQPLPQPGSSPQFPLHPGASISLFYVVVNFIFFSSPSPSQTFYVIYNI